jgi:hypothetical protein
LAAAIAGRRRSTRRAGPITRRGESSGRRL